MLCCSEGILLIRVLTSFKRVSITFSQVAVVFITDAFTQPLSQRLLVSNPCVTSAEVVWLRIMSLDLEAEDVPPRPLHLGLAELALRR